MNNFKLTSEKRDLFGRRVKTLRKKGLIPANVFGKKIKSEAVSINLKEFKEIFDKAGETQIILLNNKPVLVSNVQFDPVSSSILHVDFRQVDLSEKITANIPLEIAGESPAEKQSIGTVVQQLSEIEVEALPTDLPEKIEVDVSILTEVDQAIYVKDIKLDGKIIVKTDPDSIVAKVEPPIKEEVVETPSVAVEGETSPSGENSSTEPIQPEEKEKESSEDSK